MTDPSINRTKRELKDTADLTENRVEEFRENVQDA